MSRSGPLIVATGVTWPAPGSDFRLVVPDLVAEGGQVLAVSGPTRSGKSALLHLLAGWQQPTSGAVDWPGSPSDPPPWSHLAVVTQRLALLDELRIGENIRFPLVTSRAPGRPDDGAHLAEVVGRLDLGRLLDRAVDELSIGERQRVMVARALAGRPPIVLADEPIAHQDERRGEATLLLLEEAAAAGAAVVIATREPTVAERATVRVNLDAS